jgi:hypothetical protein
MINQIILSCNEDPNYIQFWQPVAWAYKKMFPEVRVHLAFLTNRSEDDELVKEMRAHGDVTLFKPLADMQEFSQAKMIRFILASMQGDDICYIDDIDLLPLRKDFITNKTDRRPKNTLLCVGGEVYKNNGCYPVSQMTAEGYVWKKFINPIGFKDHEDILQHYRGTTRFDPRENPDIKLDFKNDKYFSDERLIRRLRSVEPVDIFEMKRGYDDFLEATVDRYRWLIDLEKLKNHGYVNAHGIRPYEFHKEKYVPLMEYISNNY